MRIFDFYNSNMEIRWHQRFQNFNQAYLRLMEAARQDQLNELERNGLIQRFEFTIDLSWKVMKDYLEEKGFSFKPSPKDTFRQAQQAGLIDFAQALIDGLNLRNELSHDYSGVMFENSEKELMEYVLPALTRLWEFFKAEAADNRPNPVL